MPTNLASSVASQHRPQLDLICMSHLRWDFVYQRPQHLLSRAARSQRVFYIEEPVLAEGQPRLVERPTSEGVTVVVPHLPYGLDGRAAADAQRTLIDRFLVQHNVALYALWYYMPMALDFTRHLRPSVVVYDAMDELSLFRFAPASMLAHEAELLSLADVVFTGGPSLYEAKRDRHRNVHLMPSSVDVEHFAQARNALADAPDQAELTHPRLGFFGVIDERMDMAVLAGIADARPDWELVMVGPVVKIDPADLPQRKNIHYLGPRSYAELPRYVAHWDVAFMPWAINDATRFISPTKTPEFLAAGRPIVSTPIEDVVRSYGAEGLVRIAATAKEFVLEVEAALAESCAERRARIERADACLAHTSWDRTWGRMYAEFLAAQDRSADCDRANDCSPTVVDESDDALIGAVD